MRFRRCGAPCGRGAPQLAARLQHGALQHEALKARSSLTVPQLEGQAVLLIRLGQHALQGCIQREWCVA